MDKIKILIVDDHPMMREALAEEMAAQKVQPTSAGDVATRAAPEK